MIIADYVAIGVILLFALIGGSMGFGRFLEFLTHGITGMIISIVVCYFLFGIVLDWSFVQNLLAMFVEFLQSNDNFICNLLLQVRIDLIVFAVALFIVVQILKKIAASLVCNIFEIDFFAIRIVNKLFGIVLALAFLIALTLIGFQLVTYASSDTIGQFSGWLSGSFFKLDVLFIENPLHSILESIHLGF